MIIFYHYSIHVRRTDKLAAEAAFHGIDEYMKYVAEYYVIIAVSMLEEQTS